MVLAYMVMVFVCTHGLYSYGLYGVGLYGDGRAQPLSRAFAALVGLAFPSVPALALWRT